MFIEIPTTESGLSLGVKIIIGLAIVFGIIGVCVTIGTNLHITWLCLLIYVKGILIVVVIAVKNKCSSKDLSKGGKLILSIKQTCLLVYNFRCYIIRDVWGQISSKVSNGRY